MKRNGIKMHKVIEQRIIPPKKSGYLDLRELYERKELLYFFCWREIKIRYKQAFLGVSWAVLQPFIKMVVFSVIFGQLANLSSDGVPYPIFSFLAILPWNLFSDSVTRGGNSLVANAGLLKKVYIPPLIVTLGSMLPSLFDFSIASIILIGMMVVYRQYIVLSWAILLLPIFIMVVVYLSLSISLWLSALNVKYRDVRYVIPFMLQIGMYVSPVVYSTNEVPSGIWRLIYGLNPMAGVIQAFRWAFLGGSRPDDLMGLSIIITTIIFITGLRYFRKTQHYIADIV